MSPKSSRGAGVAMFLLQPFQVVPVFTLNPDAADPGVLAAFAAGVMK